MNPGKSFAGTGSFPSERASVMVASNVSFDVCNPRMTSTSFMRGTGFMKCIPITCPGRFVAAAIFVMEMDEVFVARIRPAGTA